MTQEGYDLMDGEARDTFDNVIVTKKEVKKDTVIKHKEYGDITVTEGNYILKSRKGEETGITPVDFESRYKPLDIDTKSVD